MDVHIGEIEKEATAHVAAVMDDMRMCRDSSGGSPSMAGMAGEWMSIDAADRRGIEP